MNDEEIKNQIRKFALQNAAEHDGQTRDKTILAKILGTIPELRQKVKEISPVIAEVVSEINQIPLDEQQKEIAEKSKESLDSSKVFDDPIVTQIVPAPEFYKAEDYHQKYFKKQGF